MFNCKFVPSKIGTYKNGDHAPQSCCFPESFKKNVITGDDSCHTSVTVSTTVAMLLSKRGNLTFSSLGTIKTIGVETYWDPNRENKAQLINWDEMLVGASKDVTMYIRSVSNQKVTLDLEATDWNLAKLAGYTALSCDYNGASLDPREIIQVTLTLSFSSSESLSRYLIEENVLNYSFVINIVAS